MRGHAVSVPEPRRAWAKTVCRLCGLSHEKHSYGGAYHTWSPVPVVDVPTLPDVVKAITYLYEHAGWLDYPASGLLEATARQTRVPRPLLDIAFTHAERARQRRGGP